ncbi:MAG TPA: PLP-dependent aspartate aminotransferase family protein [Thermoplasmata archaeon]|nr:PLP-dependent aspartate aminotransferase family protein [Thermoplasmata archaeon]
MRFATKAIHVGQEPDPRTGAVTVPIYMTSTYSQKAQQEWVYGRTGNPTRAALERNLAALEEGKHGLCFSSGMGAITTILTLLKKGDHVVVSDDCYGGVYRIFTRIVSNYGVESTFVDMTDLIAVEDAVRPETKMIWTETPTNPLMKVVDLKELAVIAKAHNAISVCDNTFASPYLQQPLTLGIDLAVHSVTKYLGGHADILGGAVVTRRNDLHERLKFAQNALGAVPSPFDCWLALRGVKTLAVRMERHCDNAEALAKFLAGHPKVERVLYPGLASHPGSSIAKRQMRRSGGMLSFVLEDGSKALEILRKLEVAILAESLGGVETLIEHPASMTHASLPKEEREARGITDGLVRLSVGIEDIEDLVEDFQRALA